ncbi:MAG TPA: DMT family transporter [Coxiellaceae bacterium]|nr:DMT family transporter [Coxiellaceae bacterium]
MNITRQQNIKLGIFYAIISALSFALMSVLVKKIGNDLPTSMLIFFRFSISLILLLPWVIKNPHFTFKIQQPAQYIIRILAALLGLFFVFYAIKFIPLVDALLLNNTSPLFVPLIAWLLVGAKTPAKALFGIALGFVGIAIILHPGLKIISFASLIALASGLLVALAIVQMRLISKTSQTIQMLFYYFLVSTIISGIVAALQWKSPIGYETWFLLLGIGIFGTLYQVVATMAYVTAPVRLISPLIFLTVIFGGLFDWLIWGSTPSLLTYIGTLLVIIGAIITIYFGQQSIKQSLPGD